MFVIEPVSRPGIADIICGRCKKSCKIHAFNEMNGTPGHNLSYATLEARFPYGSPKDTEHHQLHLCEVCYDWLRALLKELGTEIDVAEGDIWTGVSHLDVPKFPIFSARHGWDRTTENPNLCLCGKDFQSAEEIKEHFRSVGFYV